MTQLEAPNSHEQAVYETNRLWLLRQGETALENDHRKWCYARDNRERALVLEAAERKDEVYMNEMRSRLDRFAERTDEYVERSRRKTIEYELARSEAERLSKENDYLRGLVGNGNFPCVYCGLSREDMAKCPSGFPGCSRADDILCAPVCEGCLRIALARKRAFTEARCWLQERNPALAEELYRAMAGEATKGL